MIRYREIQPSAQLRPFVRTFWILEHDGEEATPQRVVPDGHSELILNWGRPFEMFQRDRWIGQPRHFLAGQIDQPLLLRPKGPAKMLGIGFHPHGAARLFAPSMRELSGRFTPIEDLSPALARDLDRSLNSPDPLAAVEATLLGCTHPGDPLVAEAVRRIALAKGASGLAGLARDLGLSIRQLERRFRDAVGLPPKVFCRIERFNNVFRVLGQGAWNWVETAMECGYYDQAHLIRDCKDIAGATPASLLAADTDLAFHFYQRFGMSHSYNTARRAAL